MRITPTQKRELRFKCVEQFEETHGWPFAQINSFALFETCYDDEVGWFERWHDSRGKTMREIVRKNLEEITNCK